MNISSRGKALAGVSGAALAAMLLFSGCKHTEPFQDAPVTGHNKAPAEIIDMPDGFSNVGEKCDGHGHRIFVVFHGDSGYGSVAVIADPDCR